MYAYSRIAVLSNNISFYQKNTKKKGKEQTTTHPPFGSHHSLATLLKRATSSGSTDVVGLLLLGSDVDIEREGAL